MYLPRHKRRLIDFPLGIHIEEVKQLIHGVVPGANKTCRTDCKKFVPSTGPLRKMCLQTEALHIYPQVAETILDSLILLPAGERA